MSRSHQHHKTAFTLVELLVVMAIIGILTGLLFPTIRGVMMRAQVTRIVMEIKQLESGLEAYKKKFDDYPPDFSNPMLVVRHARKAFPRVSDSDINFLLGAVYGNLNLLNIKTITPDKITQWNIDPAEALVFWLSGFSEDATNPFRGQGGPFGAKPRNTGHYDFDGTRLFLGDDGDPYPVYLPRSFELPYVFFDARTYSYVGPGGIPQYPPPGKKKQKVAPSSYHRQITGRLRPYRSSTPNEVWTNEKTFQILAAGIGDDFGGSAGKLRFYPSGAFFDKGDKKNIANFSGGQLGDSTQ
ncbi:MAG TPA: type II secretion system protein [Planctomycetaceae bacterium]|nr:type II secretion system protein [Planctomycetaceae bacterium]